MLKLIYLAKRKPGFGFDDFVRRWRMHGARGMEGSFWRHVIGYVQAEPIRPAPLDGATDEFDAVACMMVNDDAFAEPPNMDEEMAMAKDELETFSASIPSTSLWVQEERVVDGPLGGVAAYLFFASEAAARDAVEACRTKSGFSRVVLDVRHDDGPLGPGANTLPYAAVVELGAADIPALSSAFESTGVVPTADVAVLTREAVLWDRMP